MEITKQQMQCFTAAAGSHSNLELGLNTRHSKIHNKRLLHSISSARGSKLQKSNPLQEKRFFACLDFTLFYIKYCCQVLTKHCKQQYCMANTQSVFTSLCQADRHKVHRVENSDFIRAFLLHLQSQHQRSGTHMQRKA